MRVCLMIEGQEGVTWEQWVALARACEEHGLEGLFRSDHYLSVMGRPERGSLDAWATLAALAAETERIRLGTLVSPVTFRHPAVLAKTVVTVDHISGGRVELGMGAGWHEAEHRAYGFDFPGNDARMSLLAEQLEIVHGQWKLEGSALPKPVQDPHPPLIIGGRAGPRSVSLAARWADENNTISATPEECRRRRQRVADAWEREGRDRSSLRFSLMTGCVIGTDREDVLRRAARFAEGDAEALLRKSDWVTGTVEQAVAQLHEFEDAGVNRVMLQHLAHDDLEMVALLGREVVPAVAAS